jgi:sugar lactone lactonase YvrE
MFDMNRTFSFAGAVALALLVAGCSAGSNGLSTVRAIPSESRIAAGKSVDSIFFVTNYHDVGLYDTLSGVSQGSITTGIIFPVSIAFDPSGNLFIGNTAGGIKDAGTITEYSPTSSTPIRTIKKGVDDPFYLATDAAGNVYSANQFGNTITVYAPGATKPTHTIGTGVQVPIFVLVDASNNVYVANTSGTGSVTEYASGSTTPSRTITTGVNLPFSLALDSKGNLFVGNYMGRSVTEYAPGGTTPIHTIEKGKVPTSIAIDAKNNLYVAAYGKAGVTEYSPAGKLLRTIKDGINYPHSIAISPGGQLVVANYGTGSESGSVSTYGPTGTKVLHEITDGIESPLNLAFALPQVSINP